MRHESNITADNAAVDWNKYAKFYDAGVAKLSPYQEMVRDIIANIPKQATSLLDAGCGTGNVLVAAMARDSRCELYGIDSSQEMLGYARRKLEARSVDLRFGDLLATLPYADNSIDVVTCSNVLYSLSDPKVFLCEVLRVLKPKGRCIITGPKEGYENGLILKAHCNSDKPNQYWLDAHASPEREETLIKEAIADESIVEAMLRVGYYNRIIRQTATFNFLTTTELESMVRSAGFANVTVTHTYAMQGYLCVAEGN